MPVSVLGCDNTFNYFILFALEKPKHKSGCQVTDSSVRRNADVNSKRNTKLCAILAQSSRTTGAIGDVNGDNKLDLVLTYNAEAMDCIDVVETRVDVVVVELEKEYSDYLSLMSDKTFKSVTVEQPEWKPNHEQIWTEYMGHNSLSRYKVQTVAP